MVGGMSAGAIGQFIASPTDLVKVQMQMEGKRKLEGKPLRLVPLRAGGFFLITDHSLAQGVVLCAFCHPLSPAALCPLTGRAHDGSGHLKRGGESRPAPYSLYTHLLYSDLLVPGTTNPSSVLQHVHGEGRMLSEDRKLEERMREMARAGCTGTGKAGTQQGLRPSCKYEDMLLCASQTAAITWCHVHLVLHPVWDLRVVCC